MAAPADHARRAPRRADRTYVDPTAAPGTAYTYYVSALNRYHRESPVSAGRAVPAGGGGGAIVVDGPAASSTGGVSTWSPQRYGADYRFAAPAAVDQRVNGGRWVGLGTFDLAAGAYNVVGVSRWTSAVGYVIADSVRLTRL